jgi:hypothetical protein
MPRVVESRTGMLLGLLRAGRHLSQRRPVKHFIGEGEPKRNHLSKSFKPAQFITRVHLARIMCNLLTTYWQTRRALKAGFARRELMAFMPTSMSETSAVFGQRGRTPEPTDLIFPKWQRELFKTIDREGRSRTAYSQRHTYMCLRLMEGCGHLPNR